MSMYLTLICDYQKVAQAVFLISGLRALYVSICPRTGPVDIYVVIKHSQRHILVSLENEWSKFENMCSLSRTELTLIY